MRRLLFILGTRPEAIKMAPVIQAFRKDPQQYDVQVCVTAQHRELLDQVLPFFRIAPDYDLDIMRPDQSLFSITALGLAALEPVVAKSRPDMIFVQGDTTTTLVGALAGFYMQVPVAHVEAGLRSGRKDSPFPEEANRVVVSHIADYHFAPTEPAQRNLARESIREHVHVVGNTIVDALILGLSIIDARGEREFERPFHFVDFAKRIILVTGHRRESFGQGLASICRALRKIVSTFDDIEIVYPLHPNPSVGSTVRRELDGTERVHLVPALGYPQLIWLMSKSTIVITDSGGIQEEAPSLGKPVLVTREVTERTEGIKAVTARLVGTDCEVLCRETERLLLDPRAYRAMAGIANPYGDGRASERIRRIIDGGLA